MIDFSYHGEKLSDYGCMVASINTTFSNSVPLGVNLTFDTIRNRASYHNKMTNARYEEVVTATFDICKNPVLFPSQEKMIFTSGEISHFMRWLNQKTYYKFKPIYEDNEYSDLYFYGSFTNIAAIVIGGNVVGFTLTFTSNSPFGYVDDKEFHVDLTESDGQFAFYDDSDEIGTLYPYFFQVKCPLQTAAPFTLKITNDRTTKATVIANCKYGEILTMDCVNKIIQARVDETSETHSTLYNDFNYNYPCILNDLTSRRNLFTVSVPCSITMRYAPTRKAGIIV